MKNKKEMYLPQVEIDRDEEPFYTCVKQLETSIKNEEFTFYPAETGDINFLNFDDTGEIGDRDNMVENSLIFLQRIKNIEELGEIQEIAEESENSLFTLGIKVPGFVILEGTYGSGYFLSGNNTVNIDFERIMEGMDMMDVLFEADDAIIIEKTGVNIQKYKEIFFDATKNGLDSVTELFKKWDEDKKTYAEQIVEVSKNAIDIYEELLKKYIVIYKESLAVIHENKILGSVLKKSECYHIDTIKELKTRLSHEERKKIRELGIETIENIRKKYVENGMKTEEIHLGALDRQEISLKWFIRNIELFGQYFLFKSKREVENDIYFLKNKTEKITWEIEGKIVCFEDDKFGENETVLSISLAKTGLEYGVDEYGNSIIIKRHWDSYIRAMNTLEQDNEFADKLIARVRDEFDGVRIENAVYETGFQHVVSQSNTIDINKKSLILWCRNNNVDFKQGMERVLEIVKNELEKNRKLI
jgi:hypothetical protein